MSPDQFRASLRAAPFVPFRIRLVDQRTFDVPHREFAMLVPSGRTAYVVTPDVDVPGIIDVALIVSLSPIGGSTSGTRAA